MTVSDDKSSQNMSLVQSLADSLREVEEAMKSSVASRSAYSSSIMRPAAVKGAASEPLMPSRRPQTRRAASDTHAARQSVNAGPLPPAMQQRLPQPATPFRPISAQNIHGTQQAKQRPGDNHLATNAPAAPQFASRLKQALCTSLTPGGLPMVGQENIPGVLTQHGGTPTAYVSSTGILNKRNAPLGLQNRPPPSAASDAGTNASWWRPGSTASAMSYPTTAVTDKTHSISTSQFNTWVDRINQLEHMVQKERTVRQRFERELTKLRSETVSATSRASVAMFAKSADAGAAPRTDAGRRRA
mmetsp:Transcript_25546/g.55644  ORF Transcript_25546/g.55644 Transcript_25546/m.55644 type:complete len:301 (-) Transcript_25546:734-1636(-)